MQLNNRGQSLVMFILIIPILLGIMAMVMDIGNVIYNKQDIDNINKIVISYGLTNMADVNIVREMENLALLNNSDMHFVVEINQGQIIVDSTYYVKGVFSKIFATDGYLVRSKYSGYLTDKGKEKIVKIK